MVRIPAHIPTIIAAAATFDPATVCMYGLMGTLVGGPMAATDR
jgi:hypothetical protein